MLEWKDLDPAVLDTMQNLGWLGPTVNFQDKELKGYWYDETGEGGKVYLSADELKHMANHLIIVARWLEQRADEERIKNV